YNKYYPPELAHYEARNASPDRSHNETFDALVMTGVLGFAVYMALFISIFYRGFEWLGLIGDPLHRRLFAVCAALGGLLGLLVPPLVDGSLRFIGVGVPVGFALALAAYVTVSAAVDLLGRRRTAQAPASPDTLWRALLLVALLSAVMAHFVEIHFGIAIAATRLYFWTYAALLAVIGREQVALAQPAVGPAAPTVALPAERDSRRARKQPRRKAKRAQAARSATAAQPSWRTSESICLVPLALVSALILVTQCWTFVTNPLASSSPFHILLTSFTTLAARREPDTVSLGLLWLLLITFGVGLVTSVAQIAADSEAEKPLRWWARNAGWFCLIAGGIGLLYGLVHASRLGPGADVSNLMVEYYLAIAAIGLALAATFYLSGPRPAKWAGSAAAIIYPALPVAAVLFISVANMRMVKADIIYKQGLRFDETGAWDNAIYIYRQAIDVAPNEDYYYLFYGRALLERAKQEASSEQRKALFAEALRTLREARDLNPLNTDHTANLARLYRNWAETESDPERRRDMLLESARYYKAATELSPNNAQLYNEWGLVQHLMGNTEEALAKYEQSLALDQQFAQTYMLLGDLYLSRKHYAQVVEAYSEALRLEPRLIQAWSALGYAYSQLGDIRQAISANLRVLEIAPDDYGTIKNLAVLHHQAGEYDAALPYAEKAAGMAPESEKQVLDGFVAQLKAILAEE
ncbi:MAG: tetratricopeptide repeat protein, partial [Chloroflexi bacterium]|nr:tetratricopeptide repeat protein [Chloroflexota bacterium]